MLTHDQIWRAIDRLAQAFGFSASGLARQAGLDPTSFNKSKRFGPDGKPRWPSTESVSRILQATGATMGEFISLVDDSEMMAKPPQAIPLIGFAQAGSQGFFDEQGYPAGGSWDEISFPDKQDNEEGLYALQINGDSMEPLYRKNDILVVSPRDVVRKGDRVIVKTKNGEIMAKELVKQSPSRIEVRSLNENYENRRIPAMDIAWIARIIWVSQ